jgi:hypothetical protein
MHQHPDRRGSGWTGDEGSMAEDEIRQASDQFYAALNRLVNGDPAPILGLWSQGPDVARCIRSAGARSAGRKCEARGNRWPTPFPAGGSNLATVWWRFVELLEALP